ncbi:CYTH domain-containing protein [candidate division KSB1 bacterium]|nr:MAG: CYTH domain-containing protein [candidate division KSB1 bacterium]
MNRNVEIKAILRDRYRVESIVKNLCTEPMEILVQHDIFFPSPRGRLKLRIFSPESGELIFYRRPDGKEARTSLYEIFPTDSPLALRQALEDALGITGEVKKTRTLYMIGQTRVHLDRVESLGDFIELEVVLHSEQTEEEGQAIARDLADKLGIHDNDLLAVSYVDMLGKKER